MFSVVWLFRGRQRLAGEQPVGCRFAVAADAFVLGHVFREFGQHVAHLFPPGGDPGNVGEGQEVGPDQEQQGPGVGETDEVLDFHPQVELVRMAGSSAMVPRSGPHSG